jgi:flagellar protein FlaG
MGIQIASLSPQESIAVAPQHDFKKEKRQLLPVEQTALNRAEPSHQDGQKTQELAKTTSDLAHISMAFDRRLKRMVDQESNQIIIKVIDNETDKVIKVLPPEELQRLHSRIRKTIGLLFDTVV